MTAALAKLLIVDDERLHLQALCDTLQQEGFATSGFTSGKDALQALRDQEFDLLLTDLRMPEMDGISLLRAALEIDKSLVGILMTGQGTIATAVDAMKMGAMDYVLKPLKLSVVLPVISRALNLRRLRMENIQLLETVGIYELSMAIAFAVDSETIIRKMADAAFHQGEARSVSVFVPTPDGKEWLVAVSLGENSDELQGRKLPMSTWLAATDVNADEDTSLHSVPGSSITNIASGLAIPMLAAGRVIGILNLCPDRPERPVPLGRIKTLNILAGTAAAALNSASLLQELRTAEQRYRRLADNAPDVVFRYELSPQPRCVYMSPAVTKLSGYTPENFYAEPRLLSKLVAPEDHDSLEAIFAGDTEPKTTTLRWTPPDRSPIWIELHHVFMRDKEGRPIAIDGIARDVTERINLESQLRQSQKLEGVGQLAGGIAHDFNNLLTVILGRSQMLQKKLGETSPLQRDVDLIHKTAERAASLTRQLLAFSRKQLLQPRVVDLNTIVTDMGKMLQRLIGEQIELITVLNPDLGRVKVDPGQMEQVILNLAVNARDAMPQGGKLTIETGDAVLDETYSRRYVSVKPGHYVMLAVTDSGCGMDAQTQGRIFEPFFTTKELGKGTGMGLSTVYGIVKQSGGNIWVYSELGSGSAFKVYLPRVEDAADQIPGIRKNRQSTRGTETILLVEDEETVRELSEEILRDEGYKVLVAANGVEAVKVCETHVGPIDLVITDVVMPKMGGPELARQLDVLRPSAKMLFLSGYTNASIAHNNVLKGDAGFLQKPFTAETFRCRVREILDATEVANNL